MAETFNEVFGKHKVGICSDVLQGNEDVGLVCESYVEWLVWGEGCGGCEIREGDGCGWVGGSSWFCSRFSRYLYEGGVGIDVLGFGFSALQKNGRSWGSNSDSGLRDQFPPSLENIVLELRMKGRRFGYDVERGVCKSKKVWVCVWKIGRVLKV